MSDLELALEALIEKTVEQKLAERLPEIIRALGIREAQPETEELVGALEVARLLGRDVSTPENIRRAKKHVYNLARQNLIPSVRVSPRCLKFDLSRVKAELARGGNAEPYSRPTAA
jgi:hypothetical protein